LVALAKYENPFPLRVIGDAIAPIGRSLYVSMNGLGARAARYEA
jgi:hypothetical protein